MSKCKDCSGLGVYEIRNAYKPDFKKFVECDTCKGLGVIDVGQKFSSDLEPKPVN